MRRGRVKVLRQALVCVALSLCGTAFAEVSDQPLAPPATEVRLLDEHPNWLEALEGSWSSELPDDIREAKSSNAHFGLLLNASMQPTTLSQCIALALKNNTGLQVQRLNPIAAANSVRRARAIFDPALFATINKDRMNRPATTFLTAGGENTLINQNFTMNAGVRKLLLTGGDFSVQFNNNRLYTNPSVANPVVPVYTTSLGATLQQPLLRNFGWQYALLLVEVAQNVEQASFFQYVAALTNLVANVERAYWTLVLAVENVRVQEQGLSVAQELLRQNEGKYKVGALPQTAVLEAQVDVAGREALLIQARNGVDVARDTVRALINAKDEDTGILLMIDPIDRPTVEPFAIDLERSLQSALAQRPELSAARYDIEARGLQRKAAQNQLLPQLNLVAGIGLNGVAGTDAKVRNSFVSPTPGVPPPTIPVNPTVIGGYGDALGLLSDGRFYNYAIGATVQVPIDNAQAKADYTQANINLAQSKLTMQQLQESVTLEIKNSVSNLQSDLKSIEATRIARQLAEENVRNQRARYDVGLATTKDLLDYTDRLTRAQFAEVQALATYHRNLAEMRRVEGTLLEARNVVVERATQEKVPWWAMF